MPCYTMTTIRIDVGKWNQERATEAIAQAGFGRQVHIETGKNGSELVMRGIGDSENARKLINQKYSELTLRAAAKRFGWQAGKTVETEKGLLQFNLTRR